MTTTIHPQAWGLQTNEAGELVMDGIRTLALAEEYGTPLHIVHEQRLYETALKFRESAEQSYPGKVTVHYPFKCNGVPGVIHILQQAGLHAEVMTPFELELAQKAGFQEEEIIVNGPCKTDEFLHQCVCAGAKLIIVDSLEELEALQRIADQEDAAVNILLRINPDYVPKGMNDGSATGSRKGCAFGFDLKGSEIENALVMLEQNRSLSFRGLHFHIGTGITRPADYVNALRCLPSLLERIQDHDMRVRVLDVGGGFASSTSREFNSLEMLLYQAFGTLPTLDLQKHSSDFIDFTRAISDAVISSFPTGELPELLYEPGRCIVSPNQLLLLTVHRMKTREGVGTWLITDGGVSTVTLPTFYEYHEVFLCNDVTKLRTERVTLIGPACFAGDVIYRNKPMPPVRSGEILAVMDSGAYFTQLESSFGFARPAIVGVNAGSHHLMRDRETFAQSIERDHLLFQEYQEEQVP
ncbi:MAG: hypothetical protein V1799_21495 [bacterium]